MIFSVFLFLFSWCSSTAGSCSGERACRYRRASYNKIPDGNYRVPEQPHASREEPPAGSAGVREIQARETGGWKQQVGLLDMLLLVNVGMCKKKKKTWIRSPYYCLSSIQSYNRRCWFSQWLCFVNFNRPNHVIQILNTSVFFSAHAN